MHKKAILKKTFQFGYLTFLSRILGIIRDFLQVRFLGVSAISDAFLMAFRIPNFLRKIFAEGALSSASVPVFVKLKRGENNRLIDQTMTASFLFFEGIVGVLCILVFLFPHIVIKCMAPGFSPEQVAYAIPFLKILFPFIFFISSSALLAAALQSTNHFFAPAAGPVVLNIFYIASLLLCLYYDQNVLFLCKGIIVGGIANFLLHLLCYFKYNFSFGALTPESLKHFRSILKKFLPCLLGVGIVEVNMFVDSIIASYLPKGSVSLLIYGARFMQIPLGVFAVGFATVLLPYFSTIVLYAPKRLKFLLLETTKFVTWVVLPAIFFLMFTAEKLFLLLFRNGKATPDQIIEAKQILILYASGLIFFSLNKVFVNIFYALKDTKTPTIAALISAIVNLVGSIIGIYFWGSRGIAAATVLSGLTLTGTCLFYLAKKHHISFYGKQFYLFSSRYMMQFICSIGLFYATHMLIFKYMEHTIYKSFVEGWGYWLFTIPLFLFTMGFMFLSRKWFNIKLYYLNK